MEEERGHLKDLDKDVLIYSLFKEPFVTQMIYLRMT
jgi:hypothetical protein